MLRCLPFPKREQARWHGPINFPPRWEKVPLGVQQGVQNLLFRPGVEDHISEVKNVSELLKYSGGSGQNWGVPKGECLTLLFVEPKYICVWFGAYKFWNTPGGNI